MRTEPFCSEILRQRDTEIVREIRGDGYILRQTDIRDEECYLN
jgi:hypothetical protein